MSGVDVLALGESLGLVISERTGRIAHAREMRLGFGGAESNVAIGVARLGGSAGWIGRVGADSLGEFIVRELRAEGVEVHAAVDESASTALMVKERPARGVSRVTYYRSVQAGSRMTPEDLPEGVVESARILHVTGVTVALGRGPRETVHAAIDRARAAGVLVSFDVNHRSSLWATGGDAPAAYRELAARADIVFAGADEAALLTGEDAPPEQQAAAIRALGAPCAVIKLGGDGAYGENALESGFREAVAVDVVDTVGAGDAFVSGWLSETVRDASMAQRLATATACGAAVCTAEGDWEAAPTRADLARLEAPGAEPVLR